MNPIYASRYAELMRDALSVFDPAHAPQYRECAQQFTTRSPASTGLGSLGLSLRLTHSFMLSLGRI